METATSTSFSKRGTNVVYEETEITGLVQSLDLQELESLEKEKLYAIRVIAEDVDNETTIQNDGASNLIYFRYREEIQDTEDRSNARISMKEPFVPYLYSGEENVFSWELGLPNQVNETDGKFSYELWRIKYTIDDKNLPMEENSYNWDEIHEGLASEPKAAKLTSGELTGDIHSFIPQLGYPHHY